MRRILVTGKNGQVGWELQRTLACLGKIIALDYEDMDFANPDSIVSVLREVKPDLIVNAAAYTAVDRAEGEPELAMAVNGIAPGIIAEEAKRLGIGMVHYSTDYVFDGEKQKPYTEADTPNPINAYGKTKLAGEQAIQAVGISHLILRTSWVYGARGKNFLLTMRRLAKEKHELTIVDDQIGAPTWSRMIAEATAQILVQRRRPAHDPLGELCGVYHLTAGGRTSWFHFARAIFEQASRDGGHPLPKLIPIQSRDYPTPAKRPKNSVLSNEKFTLESGLAMSEWSVGLELCLQGLVW